MKLKVITASPIVKQNDFITVYMVQDIGQVQVTSGDVKNAQELGGDPTVMLDDASVNDGIPFYTIASFISS